MKYKSNSSPTGYRGKGGKFAKAPGSKGGKILAGTAMVGKTIGKMAGTLGKLAGKAFPAMMVASMVWDALVSITNSTIVAIQGPKLDKMLNKAVTAIAKDQDMLNQMVVAAQNHDIKLTNNLIGASPFGSVVESVKSERNDLEKEATHRYKLKSDEIERKQNHIGELNSAKEEIHSGSLVNTIQGAVHTEDLVKKHNDALTTTDIMAKGGMVVKPRPNPTVTNPQPNSNSNNTSNNNNSNNSYNPQFNIK